jgi:nitrite reductase/ring-hydroxylating ferredoxin subunit
VSDFIDAAPDDWVEPGRTATVDVDGTAVALANVDGTMCAFANDCPHQATQLGGLPLTRGRFIMCPGHNSMFDVTSGQCVVPSQDGWTGTLQTYETRVVDGVVQVRLPW